MKVVDGKLISTNPVNLDAEIRAYGVNYFDVFIRMLEEVGYSDYIAGFSDLAANNIAFVRFPLGYWPNAYTEYNSDKVSYFDKLKLIFDEAELNGIGVIPSLFFTRGTIPDVVGEPCSSWGIPNSATIAFMDTYIDDFFANLGSHKALWAVEFGNEYNLYLDLPNSDQFRPGINELKGTPALRTVADELTVADFQHAIGRFCTKVRANSPTIPITSGNTLQREYSFNNTRFNSWAADSDSHIAFMSKFLETSGTDLSSIHMYPQHKDKFAIYTSAGSLSYSEVISKHTTPLVGKKSVFLGEFGVSALDGTVSEVQADFELMLGAIHASDISLACLWSYRFAFQDADWNVTTDNTKAYQLVRLGELNTALAATNSLALF